MANQSDGQAGFTRDLFATAPRETVPTPKKRNKVNGVDHLAATRKLHWRLRKARSHSPEEMKAGRLICQHLLAMLDEAKNDPSLEVGSSLGQVRHN